MTKTQDAGRRMNKFRAFIAGKILHRPTATAPRMPSPFGDRCNGHSRTWTRYDAIAKRKRIARRRAKKGYK